MLRGKGGGSERVRTEERRTMTFPANLCPPMCEFFSMSALWFDLSPSSPLVRARSCARAVCAARASWDRKPVLASRGGLYEARSGRSRSTCQPLDSSWAAKSMVEQEPRSNSWGHGQKKRKYWTDLLRAFELQCDSGRLASYVSLDASS